MMTLDTHELAWAAGFFDGEGCTTLLKMKATAKRSCPRLHMTVSQKERYPLERFQQAVAGLGRINGPYHNGAHTPMYVWAVTNWRDAQAVVALLWRFLGETKRSQYLRVHTTCVANPNYRRTRREAGLLGLAKRWGHSANGS